jgi:hypothetical protein
MKLILKLLSVGLFTCCAARAAETNEIGRYQLFTGPIDIKDDAGAVRTGSALYRIDTVTGQTWRYDQELIHGPKAPRGVFAEAWVIMAEDHIASQYLATSIAHGEEKAKTTFTHFSSPNALGEAMDRMYWPPKRRDEYDAIVAETAIQRYLATNRPPETVRPPADRKKETK